MLHSDEIEILLPEKINSDEDMPGILAVGPSFTMIVPIILMAALSSKIYGANGGNYMMMVLVTGGSSALMGLIWGVSNFVSKRNRLRKKIMKSEADYNRYIGELRKTLLEYAKDNTEYMYDRYPGGAQMAEGGYLSRFGSDKDYLFVRLGIGRWPFQVTLKKQERKDMFPDKAQKKADELIEEFRFLKRVPVGIDFGRISRLGIVGELSNDVTYGFVLDLMIKIAFSYGSDKIKMCLFYDGTDERQKRIYEVIKFLPHFFTGGMQQRLCAGDDTNGYRVISSLTEIIDEKRYLVFAFVLNEALLKGEVLHRIMYDGDNSQLKVLTLYGEKDSPGASCRDIICLPVLGKGEACLYSEGNRTTPILSIIPDTFNEALNEGCISKFAMKIRKSAVDTEYETSEEDYMPRSVDLLELFDAESIEDIDIEGFYRNNRSKDRLKVPIGMCGKHEKIYLDVHEKFHGPHGLIAGTTGSGKSELLQTYLISLCICYSPEEVNFFLIDYKGGGTGNFVGSLPHCAGVISNLSGGDIGRAMEAIRSENRRRQQLFSDNGVSHIDAYHALLEEGIVTKKLPHLLLIIDEFAELKKEEPDFMQQIISLSAVGRSLGIHLILATQKPQGVVDDKIWSNSRFRLCLKVQDKQDSMDMLHRKDAAYLRAPGECYLQIGNDEYLKCFKAGYCGGLYAPGAKGDGTGMVLESGMRIALQCRIETGKKSTLEELVDYVNQFCDANGYTRAGALWMDELPEHVELDGKFLNELCKPDEPSVLIGRFDDPASVKQGEAFYSPVTDGHLVIAGSPATGKSTLLMGIISQIGDYPFLLVSMQESDLLLAGRCSNCLGVLECREGIPIFLYHLNRMNRKHERIHFVIIDNFAMFYKLLKDDEAEMLLRLVQEGISNNIYFILTGTMPADFPSKIFSKIKTTLCLEMNDKYHYCDIMRDFRPTVIPKPGIPGRGLFKVDGRILEIQSYDPSRAFEEILKEHPKTFPVKKFPMYRKNVTPTQMSEEFKTYENNHGIIPVGYSLKSGLIRGIMPRPSGSFVISGAVGTGRHTLMNNMRLALMNLPEEVRCKVEFIEDPAAVHCAPEELDDKYIVVIVSTGNMQDIINNPLLKRITEYGEGIHLGGNAAATRLLRFDDLSYGELSLKSEPGNGLMRVHGRNSTLRMMIPYEKREENSDDYD